MCRACAAQDGDRRSRRSIDPACVGSINRVQHQGGVCMSASSGDYNFESWSKFGASVWSPLRSPEVLMSKDCLGQKSTAPRFAQALGNLGRLPQPRKATRYPCERIWIIFLPGSIIFYKSYTSMYLPCCYSRYSYTPRKSQSLDFSYFIW